MFDALRLDNKVAIVTGGAGGIGQATAKLMMDRGAHVAIADIAFDRAQAVAAELGEAALAVELDLAEEASIIAAVRHVVDRFGGIDILVNNAAAVGADLFAGDGPLGEVQTGAWDRIFDINCRGTMIITRESLPYLIERQGCIVNTVSGMGLQGHVRNTGYGATKAALIQLTRSIATAYGRKGVRCNAVGPGLILTETVARDFPANWRKPIEEETPRGCAGEPQDIAEPIAFLASAAAKNITGQTLVSDGGMSIHFPGFAVYGDAYDQAT